MEVRPPHLFLLSSFRGGGGELSRGERERETAAATFGGGEEEVEEEGEGEGGGVALGVLRPETGGGKTR